MPMQCIDTGRQRKCFWESIKKLISTFFLCEAQNSQNQLTASLDKLAAQMSCKDFALSHIENMHCHPPIWPYHKSSTYMHPLTLGPSPILILSAWAGYSPQTDCLQRPWIIPWFNNCFGSVFHPSKQTGQALVYWGKFVVLPTNWGVLGLKMVDDFWSVLVWLDLIYFVSFHI
jgi:hypothetical protein